MSTVGAEVHLFRPLPQMECREFYGHVTLTRLSGDRAKFVGLGSNSRRRSRVSAGQCGDAVFG